MIEMFLLGVLFISTPFIALRDLSRITPETSLIAGSMLIFGLLLVSICWFI